MHDNPYCEPYWLTEDELEHYGIKGMKWGVRRYQNPDGTLTEAGKKKRAKYESSIVKMRKGREKHTQIARNELGKIQEETERRRQNNKDTDHLTLKQTYQSAKGLRHAQKANQYISYGMQTMDRMEKNLGNKAFKDLSKEALNEIETYRMIAAIQKKYNRPVSVL